MPFPTPAPSHPRLLDPAIPSSFMTTNREILAYALKHLESERIHIEALISHARAALGASPTTAPAVPDPSMPDWVLSSSEKAARAAAEKSAKKQTMSAEGRARVAAAQKKRWEAIRKAKEMNADSKPVVKKKRGRKAKS